MMAYNNNSLASAYVALSGFVGSISTQCKTLCDECEGLFCVWVEFVSWSCGCVFRRQDYLHKHKLIHTGVKRHACPHCHMRFIQRSGLTVHIRKHTGERPFKCDVCPHRCVTSSNLREHRRRHQGDKRHQCTICDRKFGYKRSLEEHIASVHERSVPHPCAHCGANFANKRGLRRHVLTKHADLELAGYSSKIELEKNNCQQNVWSIKLNTAEKTDNTMKIICNEIN